MNNIIEEGIRQLVKQYSLNKQMQNNLLSIITSQINRNRQCRKKNSPRRGGLDHRQRLPGGAGGGPRGESTPKTTKYKHAIK